MPAKPLQVTTESVHTDRLRKGNAPSLAQLQREGAADAIKIKRHEKTHRRTAMLLRFKQIERLWIAAEVHKLKGPAFVGFAAGLNVDRSSAYDLLKVYPRLDELRQRFKTENSWPTLPELIEIVLPNRKRDRHQEVVALKEYVAELEARLHEQRPTIEPKIAPQPRSPLQHILRPDFKYGKATIIHGDCSSVLPTIPRQFHSAITDSPYHLTNQTDGAGFLNQTWDGGDIAFRRETWQKVYDRLLPGAFLAAFGGPRTWHKLAAAIEDAGFILRDTMMWLYGEGFPKSKNIALGIDKHLGHPNRGRAIPTASHITNGEHGFANPVPEYDPITEQARQWDDWGTGLKPSYEPIILAQKPLIGTYAENILAHGVGGMNIGACRVGDGLISVDNALIDTFADGEAGRGNDTSSYREQVGRWPSNLIHDGSMQLQAAFAQFGNHRSCSSPSLARPEGTVLPGSRPQGSIYPGENGSPSRFFSKCEWSDDELRLFYCAKASQAERGGSEHPTVKPLSLMRWICRLLCPPGGTILDPFAGSGSTGLAACLEGFDVVLIEREANYVAHMKERLEQFL
jgi:DNA modification methylase